MNKNVLLKADRILNVIEEYVDVYGTCNNCLDVEVPPDFEVNWEFFDKEELRTRISEIINES